MTHPDNERITTRVASPAEVAAYYNSPDYDPDNNRFPEGPVPVLSDADQAAIASRRDEVGQAIIRSGPSIDMPLPPEVWPVPPKETRP